MSGKSKYKVIAGLLSNIPLNSKMVPVLEGLADYFEFLLIPVVSEAVVDMRKQLADLKEELEWLELRMDAEKLEIGAAAVLEMWNAREKSLKDKAKEIDDIRFLATANWEKSEEIELLRRAISRL